MIIDLRRNRWLLLPMISACLLVTMWFGGRALLKVFYPIKYVAIASAEARKNGLDPLLVQAVIRVESRFRTDAVSKQGARGLMQVMPETGRWAADQIGRDSFNIDDLYSPAVNISIGTWYLSELEREFGGSLPAALAAYNGGRHNVRTWLSEGRWDGSEQRIDDIPFAETRHFVRSVLRDHRMYHWLYGRSFIEKGG